SICFIFPSSFVPAGHMNRRITMSQVTDIYPSEPRKSANPSPLGLAGFGLTTVVLSCANAGLMPHEAVPVIVPLAFAYGGVAQIIAGILEFRNGNTFGMVAFLSYGLFWWWFAFLQWTVGAGALVQTEACGRVEWSFEDNGGR
ncbi:acetate uptake transporter, partial [Paraburkholderia sp.]|uniref:acetate uptake transporter n=1 Tax=Paraburkholderia sp. TaxID=1926495 RepID=UPI003D6F2152